MNKISKLYSIASASMAMILFLILVSSTASAASLMITEGRINTNNSDQQDPVIYGDRIVWEGSRNRNSDIYICTLSEGRTKLNPPVANFSASPVLGNAPLEVTFTDRSTGYPNSWNWVFGDGGYSTYRNPEHTYNKAGTYTVNLTVSNEDGFSSKTAVINILEKSSGSENNDNDSISNGSSSGDSSEYRQSSGSSPSSGSSSGGTGGSPETQKNVEHRDTARVFIPNEKLIFFNFTNNVTVVSYINFESKKTTGMTTAIVEDLKNRSSLVSDLPDGIVYKSFNVWVGDSGFGDSNSILNATIGFRVEKSWIQENNIDPSSIVLNKYDDKKEGWEAIPVNIAGSDEKYLYLRSEVPGYSSFVITGMEGEPEARAAEAGQIVNTGNMSDSVNPGENDLADQANTENEKTPGFGIVSGVGCLLCLFLYRNKKR